MELGGGRVQMLYGEDFEEGTGSILCANKEMVQYLEHNPEIVVEGEEDDQFLFNINSNSFKLRGIFLPTTMLVAPLKPSNTKSFVLHQTGNYLKIEPNSIEYNAIYAFLMTTPLTHTELTSHDIRELAQIYGVSVRNVIKKFHITPAQLQSVVTLSSVAVLHPGETGLDEAVILPMDLSCGVGVMRKLVEVRIIDMQSPFTFNEVAEALCLPHQKLFMALGRCYDLSIQGGEDTSCLIEQKMEVEGGISLRYRLNLDSIVHLTILEQALKKQQYMVLDMDTFIHETLQLFLPVGVEAFSQQLAKKRVEELIGYYFMTIGKGNQARRQYYNSLTLESTLKARVQYIANYKIRFTRSQIQGVMRTLVGCQREKWEELILKHFRKCGPEYQIKLIKPK